MEKSAGMTTVVSSKPTNNTSAITTEKYIVNRIVLKNTIASTIGGYTTRKKKFCKLSTSPTIRASKYPLRYRLKIPGANGSSFLKKETRKLLNIVNVARCEKYRSA